MQERLNALTQHINRATAKREHLLSVIAAKEADQITKQARADSANVAKELVVSVANMTQQNIGDRISELVSLALASVWEDAYEFEIEFVQKRGSTEAVLYFVRNGNRVEPLFNTGGGAVDVASIALRLAVWSLGTTSPVFILDEPFRNLHGQDLNEKASTMLQALSKKLGIQVIMAAADDNMIFAADRVLHVTTQGVTQE